MARAWNTQPDDVLSFVRENQADKVFAVLNFSPEPQTVRFTDAPFEGDYAEFFSGDAASFDADTAITLEPWGYRVYVR